MKPTKDLERRVEALETRIVDPEDWADFELARRLAYVLDPQSGADLATRQRLAAALGIPLPTTFTSGDHDHG